MKKLVAILSLAGLTVAGLAMGAGSTDLTVQANVLATCGFDAAGYLMDFGNLDPAAAVDVNITTTLDFTCSNGTVYTIDDISGGSTMAGSGTAAGDALPYSIAAFTDTGTASGVSTPVDLVGTVLGTDYDIASLRLAGPYQEIVTININP